MLPTPAFLKWLPRLSGLARAQEWWEYKLAPILATAYATALLTGKPLSRLVSGLPFLVLSLMVGATYVSLLNDYTDQAEDRAAGKANRLAGRPAWLLKLLFGLCLGLGLLFGWYLAALSPAAGVFYLGAWVAYTLYSLPPFRWKTRGFLGLLADASGAHLFPQLLTVAFVAAWVGSPWPLPWLVLTGMWAFACGMRNILWHQLHDAANDALSQTRTFVYLRGERQARRLVSWVLFPVEILAFGSMLYLLHNPICWTLLLFYGISVWYRKRVWGLTPVLAAPRGRYHLVLNEYYEALYPLALLFTICWKEPRLGVVLLAVHILLFSQRLRQVAVVLRSMLVTMLVVVRNRARQLFWSS